jgi:Mg2+ and Co2+ transporter CorA
VPHNPPEGVPSVTGWTIEALRTHQVDLDEVNDRQHREHAEGLREFVREINVLRDIVSRVAAQIEGLDRLTDAKFVTFRTLIDSQAEKVALALDASKEAIDKAERSTEKARDRMVDDISQRFENVNEFRSQQKDVIGTFMPRAETEQRLGALTEKIETITGSLVEKIETMTELRLRDLKLVREQVVIADTRLDDRLQDLERGAANMQGRLWALGTAIAAVVIIVNITIRFLG